MPVVGSTGNEAVLSSLDDEQRAVATSVHGPVVVLAGAGTGKTRAITHRIAYAVQTEAHEARRSMAVTFTSRAAGEMRMRLHDLGVEGVSIRTFHAAALRQLRYFWPRISGRDFPELLPSKARIIAEAAASCGIRVDGTGLRDLSSDIEWAKVNERDPRELVTAGREGVIARQWSMDVADLSRVYEAYDALKERRGLLDFEDVLLVTVAALQTRPDIADEVRAAYRWFTVDEYQDVNPLQHRLLTLWRGDRDDVCVVGDVSQTIYTFTGASANYLTGFRGEFPDATEVRLVNCYRCSEPIVDAANKVIAQASTPGTLQLRARTKKGPRPTIRVFDDDVEEARAVAAEVAALIAKGTLPRDIAVLFRINAQSAEIESAMTDVSVPVVMRGMERFFERSEIREATTRLRGAARAGEAVGSVPDEVRAVLETMGWRAETPRGGGATRERWESLSALVALADEHADQPGRDVSSFVAELDRRADAQHAPSANAVTLASLHSAKGLEWQVVFIIGCSEGLLPLQYAETPESVEEERRLCYVGITRAREGLHLSWARARQPGGRQSRDRSRFLDALTSAGGTKSEATTARVTYGSRTPRAERVRKGPATCRICGKGLVTAPERTLGRCRTCPVDVSEAMVEGLKRWRLEQARERSVPAYVVFTDATLLAIAEQRPTTSDELARIPGIGPAKLEQYGSAVLALLADG